MYHSEIILSFMLYVKYKITKKKGADILAPKHRGKFRNRGDNFICDGAGRFHEMIVSHDTILKSCCPMGQHY
jgi:hypothetical protein